jgi:AcrR family transcriptional regulator
MLTRQTAARKTKGVQTRAVILEAALSLAAREGLEGLTIGSIAARTGMSKSGVFAHFGSREELQIATLREYHRRFEAQVFLPALQQPRGLQRLQTLFTLWVEHVSEVEIPQDCMYMSGAVDYDDRPGAVREALVSTIALWRAALHRAVTQAIQEKHLHALIDPEQLVFEMYGIMLALHHDVRLLRSQDSARRATLAFTRLIHNCQIHPEQPHKKVA